MLKEFGLVGFNDGVQMEESGMVGAWNWTRKRFDGIFLFFIYVFFYTTTQVLNLSSFPHNYPKPHIQGNVY